jgi:hypothetical protein
MGTSGVSQGCLRRRLTDDQRIRGFDTSTLRAVLHKIEASQEEMIAVIRQVIIPKGGVRGEMF